MWCQCLVSLVLQVSPALRDLLALLAPQVRALKVSLDLRDLQDLPDLLVAPLLENLGPLVDLVNLAALDKMVRRVTLEPQAPRDLGEHQVLLEAQAPLAFLLLESLDPQVFLEQWDLEENLV